VRAGRTWLQGLLAEWGWLVLLALAPLFLFPTPATTPVLLVVPALLWLQFRRPPASDLRPPAPTPLDWPILGLLVMVLVSLWATYSLAVSLVKVAGIVYGVGLFYALLAFGRRSARRLGTLTAAYLAAGAALAVVGLVGSFQTDKLPLLGALRARLPAFLIRLPGAETGIQPNEVAGFLLWVSPVALALSVAAWRHLPVVARRWGAARAAAATLSLTVIAFGATVVLVLTQSRTGLFGLAAALVVLPLAAGRRSRHVSLALLTLGIVAGLALYGDRLRALYQYAAYATADSSWPGRVFAALDARVEIWSRGIYAIGDFGFTGMGMNTFRTLVHLLYPLSLTDSGVDFGHAHNMWLQAALDLGLPGLVAYVALWLAVGVMLIQTLRSARHPGLRALAVGLAGAVAGSLAFGLPDAVALGARPSFLWWWLLALAALAWMHRDRPLVSPSAPIGAPEPARVAVAE
jgi:putative inorganic carbon (HCO3(-)) transporter